MYILSHRGYWKQTEEKNKNSAFQRSFSLGFGTELDVRDYCGKLVVSHDIADSSSLEFSKFLEIYCEYARDLYLAINIKADGLYSQLSNLLKKYNIENYFVFDMSVPDALGYLNNHMKTFTRQSEFEKDPSFYELADGVWMDEFSSHWITAYEVSRHLENNKKVCIVSPELHHRDHLSVWKDYKILAKAVNTEKLLLCTDLPEAAKEYFND
jgi:hypothetical protein